ncbi:MAG: hypothetical protein NVS3B26_03780 [Mycobacteriales bacterium]
MSHVRMAALDRSTERRLALIIGLVLGTVVLSGASALAQQHSPVSHRTAQAERMLSGVDVVAPTPVLVMFARPQPPSRTTATSPAPAQQLAARTPAVATAVAPAGAACSSEGWRQRRGQSALASLLHPVPSGVSLGFLAGDGALRGMTYYDAHHVDIYVGSCASEPDALLRHVVGHEMGHAWDSLHMTDALRADYLAARGIPGGTPWFGCNRCQDFATPAGDFAETYAQWQRGSTDSRSTLASPATAGQLADLGARFFS